MPKQLNCHPLFTIRTEFLSLDERVLLSYKRARLLMETYKLSATDIQVCSQKYWSMMTDPIMSLDFAMFTILSIQVGLAIGTLSRHLKQRPDFGDLINRLLLFETVGLYLMTERGHGLDAFNIETTATRLPQGFIINTPREEASKFMPASTPAFGIPKVALVMARLIFDGEDRGPRFFVVPICNEQEMYKGVESIRLGPRSGASPLDYSITRFNNVLVPNTALVASKLDDYSAPEYPLQAWWNEVWRVPYGTMAVTAPSIPGLKAVAYIAGQYSIRRCITGKGGSPLPIISFRTQQWPIIHATAVAHVMSNWYSIVVQQMTNKPLDPHFRHGMAIIVKTTVFRHSQRCGAEVSERCGAQGTFEHNFMACAENEAKGAIIAEGDVLALCIRLFSELVLQRYHIPIPIPDPSESLLAQHANSMLDGNRDLLRQMPDKNRHEAFDSILLPQAEPTIEAIGHAMAYSAALRSALPKPILDVYECAVIRRDPAWYSENAGLTRHAQRMREDKAVTAAMPHLDRYLEDLQISGYVSAPIVSDKAWKEYVGTMPVYVGNAVPKSIDQLQAKL
ncbi:acyl-CoA oxidase [Pisolithus marmoratus]|nr:acyl-CoA oxidase [Pisolithus marmoratus]